jgi:peptidoglycan/xylan/chitin deacetylase (PgdA/CDA1 family)
MRVPGRRLLRGVMTRARARLCGGLAILGYHRLGSADPYGIAVSADNFARHLEVLSRTAHPVSRLEGIDALRMGSLPRRAVAVTFDDCYDDTFEVVLPLIERHRVPITVFVTTGNPGSSFWWDDLAHAVLSPPVIGGVLGLHVDGEFRRFDARGATRDSPARRALLGRLADMLRPMEPDARHLALRQVLTWVGEPPGQPSHRAAQMSEVRALARCPLVEIGAHTVSHPMLPLLSPADQAREVDESRTELERATGRTVRTFSYPNGAYSDATRSIVAQAGFTAACCSMPGLAGQGDDVLLLPRLWADDVSDSEFAAWLRRWTGD